MTYDKHRWILVRGRQLALVVVDIHLHLPEVLVGQLPDLEVQEDEGPGEPVVEHQIDEEMLAVERDPLLAGHEGKPLAQFQEERLQVGNQRLLQF